MIRVLICVPVLIAVGCSAPTPSQEATESQPPPTASVDSRTIVAMSITDGPIGFDASYRHVREAGISATSLSVYWDEIERSPGEYRPDPNFLAIANDFYSDEAVSINLAIAVIDTTEIRLPSDLANRNFDDPEVIQRFNALLDWVGTQLPDVELDAVAIGNEVDIALAPTGRWHEYEHFLDAVMPHARTVFPGVPIGVKTTLDGLETHPDAVALHDGADAVMVTHYLIGEDFAAQDPRQVMEAFESATRIAGDRPVMFLELGYPSAATIGGSEEDQSRFVDETFAAMERFPQVTAVEFSWSTDISSSSVAEYEDYYGLEDDGFAAYLGSIGFIRSDGTPKPAHTTLSALLDR